MKQDGAAGSRLNRAVYGPHGLRALPGLVAALGAIYVGGLAWLAVVGSVDTAVALGLRPFILADLVKVGMVVLVMARFRDRVLRLFGS